MSRTRSVEFLTAVLLFSACATPPHWEVASEDIYASDAVRPAGKAIINLGVFYSEVHAGPAPLEGVRFVVQDAEREDVDRLHRVLDRFFTERYQDRYSFRRESVGPAWVERVIIRYLHRERLAADPRNYADLEWHSDDGTIKVRLGCFVACDRELLESLFERDPIAPLSPQARKNYETLKARLSRYSGP